MVCTPTLRFVAGILAVVMLVACNVTQPAHDAASAATPPAIQLSSAVSAQITAPEPLVASPIPVQPTVAPFRLAAGWWDTAVCYEIFVRSFYDSNGDGIGDLNGIIQKLDYINDGNPASQQDLGVNCIWLMPIMAAKSYHGYDTIDYYTVEQDYGTNADFKRLVAEAHKRGINIMLDLVLNHTSNDHPWFQDALRNPTSPYRNFYIWSKQDPGYRGPWNEQVWHKSPLADEYYYGLFLDNQPDLNYRNPAVTAEVQKITAFWRNEMGADGFRLDAIKHLIEDGTVQESTPETHAWLRGYRRFLEQTAPGTFTVGEIFDAAPSTLAPYYPDQLDSYFTFDIGKRIITAVIQGNGKMIASAAQRENDTIPYQRYAPFLTNHDQDRSMSLLGNDPAKAKVAATALLTLSGMPFIYYGEEIGLLGAKGDPPKVDEPLRTPMQWSGEANGGFSDAAPWQALQGNYTETNVAAQINDARSLLSLYRMLIHIRMAYPALSQGDVLKLDASDTNVAAFLRQKDDQIVLVIINVGKEARSGVTLHLPASTLAGAYKLTPLLGSLPGAELTVGSGGSISNFAPLATLDARTGYIFNLTH